jgi:hypothetical protein
MPGAGACWIAFLSVHEFFFVRSQASFFKKIALSLLIEFSFDSRLYGEAYEY